MLPTASKRASPVRPASETPTIAQHEPDERAGVLEQHDGQLGVLRAADELPPRRRSRGCGRDSRTAVRSESASSTNAIAEDDERDRRALELVRVVSFSMPS